MNGNLRVTDRLRDRGFVDQWGFVAFAAVGFALILFAKSFGIRTSWVAVGAIVAMLVYALIISKAGTGRVRADQAGDNCYYLGLIYTLASLSYAIATFNPTDTASTIVQGFGVALATTIVGLILRVYFSQGRPDLENIEEQTRIELTDSVARLKHELGDVVRQLNDYTRSVQQSMAELHQNTTQTISAFANGAVEQLQGVVEEAASTIREEANDFATRSKRYSTTFDKLLGKLERHGDSVDQMREAQEAVHLTAKSAESAVNSASSAMVALHGSADAARLASVSTREAIESVKELVGDLAASVSKMQSSLHQIQEESTRRIEELKFGPSQSVGEAVAVLGEAAQALRTHVSAAGELHAEVHAGMVARTESALAASKQFNEQLEAELLRSRELVGKVHGSLVNMTAKLANAVENSA